MIILFYPLYSIRIFAAVLRANIGIKEMGTGLGIKNRLSSINCDLKNTGKSGTITKSSDTRTF